MQTKTFSSFSTNSYVTGAVMYQIEKEFSHNSIELHLGELKFDGVSKFPNSWYTYVYKLYDIVFVHRKTHGEFPDLILHL